MSTLSQFFATGSNGAGTTTRLGALGKAYLPPVNLKLSDNSTGSDNASFWTNLNNVGVAVNSDFTAATYKTLLSVSGAGEVITIVGPTIATSAATLDFEVTIDGGAAQTITLTWPSATSYRAFIGATYNGAVAIIFQGVGSHTLDSTKRWLVPSGDFQLPGLLTSKAMGLPRLRFETSVLIRLRSSVNVTATGSNERQSGVIYQLD
jgi:hypothetical protein